MLFRLLRERARPYRGAIALVMVLQLAQSVAALLLPTLNARIVDEGVLRGDTGAILSSGAIMLGATLAQLAASATAGYFAARTAMAIGRDLRAAVFTRVQGLSAREIAAFGAPTLLTRSTNDAQQVQTLVLMALTSLATTPMMFIGGIAMALGLEPRLSALLLAVLPAMVGVLGFLLWRMGPPYRVMQGRLDQVNRVIGEQIAGVRVVRAFVRDRRERERFAEANEGLTKAGLKASRFMVLMFPAGMLVSNLGAVAAVWIGGHLIDDGSMRPGTLIAFLNYLALILGSALFATFTVIMAPRAQVSAERIGEVLGTRSSLVPPAAPVSPPVRRGVLELRGVGFRYPGAERPVLRGVDLTARPGQTTAIVGSTGSGKSTLLSLIPRLSDPTEGTVLIDGVDVRDLGPSDLVGLAGIAPQRSHLFAGTVRSNLSYGRPGATDAELWHALEVAQAREFVEALPDGLDAEVAQGGTNFSGGQRQRLAIARLLVARPRIYLFDDTFSALDVVTERALREALARETREATVVLVTNRVATARHADRVVVLHEGEVAGVGAHHELMRTSRTYREIVFSQLTEEEAA
ncbi:ABC transporter ATP-binding protein [Bailinhaonella thermotolerans]|uniref:ABC transporter ATP-binding protein n=1 Tax=Bailinhaonella thermotolerans TaxID=1070861 RepID=A0A3A4ATL3_9ACTN|nr:ABC transporter ATP-binding protein [Bailinhaonella thermotolerans]